MLALVNARVRRGYFEDAHHECIATANGRILHVGKNEECRRLAKEHGLEVVDARGAFVVPGFVDAHMHVESLGLALLSVDLSEARSLGDLVLMLRDYIDRKRPSVVVGRGWDHEKFTEKEMPRAETLDKASRDVPIVISRVCGHVVAVNSAALGLLSEKLEGFSERLVPRDSSGRPIGLLFEDAAYVAWEYGVSQMNTEMLIEAAARHLASNGVTSVGWMGVSRRHIEALLRVEQAGGLGVRVHAYLRPEPELREAEELVKLVEKSELVRVVGAKFFADGSLGARTAFLSEDYDDMPGWRGLLLLDEKRLRELVTIALEKGLQPATHAIGDEAVREVLRAYRATGATVRDARIEHASLAPPDVIATLKETSVMAVIQPRFVVSDWWARERLGARVQSLYPFRSMLRAGVRLALSTDAPVEPVSPWLTVIAAESNGQESLERANTLHLYTVGSAHALRRREIGVLEKGYRADFVVTTVDPLKATHEELTKARILETYVGGVRVYP